MLKRWIRWIAFVIVGLGALLLASIILGTLLEGLIMPDAPTASTRTVGAVIASIAAVLLVTLLTVAAAKKWEAKWPLGVVAASLAAFIGAGIYLYGWNPTLPADAPIASGGGSTSVPGVNTDGLDGLGEIPVPPPGRAAQKPPPAPGDELMPTFSVATNLNNKVRWAGDLTHAQFCKMCASGIPRISWDNYKCGKYKDSCLP